MMNSLLQKNWPWLVAAGLIVLWLLSTAVKFEPPIVDSRPVGAEQDIRQLADRQDLNVLFLVIDTLRADRLSAYGYSRQTSPGLDRLASKGIRFSRHLAQSSWTKTSMASMWTGLYPTHNGVLRYDHIVSEEAVMPAERLREAGFKTIGLYRNGWVAPTFGFEQGFDIYARAPQNRKDPSIQVKNPTLTESGTDEGTVAAAIEFLRISGHDQRWFMYLHLMDVHEFLYDAESALFGGAHSDMYDNSIRWTDRTLELLFEYLDDFGLAEKTIIVVTSDHGEAFRERGLEGHARALYKETTEIPLLVSLPFQLDGGAVIPTRSQNIDVWPTIFELIGLDPLDGVDGVSRVPEILAAVSGTELTTPETTGISFLDETWGRQADHSRFRVGVTEGPYRYVMRGPAHGTEDEPTEELFNSETDPAELIDLSESEPELVDQMRAAAEAQLEATPTWGEAPKRELGELELNQLRALGYAIP